MIGSPLVRDSWLKPRSPPPKVTGGGGAGPPALGAAIYVSQPASPRIREWVKPGIELLAGIPSVVLGFFALIVMATVLQGIFGYESRLNAFGAGLALSLAVIPVVFSIAEDALTSVPRAYSQAALALGAFVTREPARARAVIPRDKEVDALNKQLNRELPSFMIEQPPTITRALNLMVISKALERIADHATNIAEEVVYLYEGRDIRHSGPGKPRPDNDA